MSLAMTTTANLWEQALNELQSRLDAESFETWLRPVQFIGLDGGHVTLLVPTQFYRNWLKSNYHDQIVDTLSDLLRRDADVEYRVSDSEPPAPGSSQDAELSATEQQAMRTFRMQPRADGTLISSRLNPNYTFDNFVVGESNRFAHAAAQAVADPQYRVYNPLFIYGGVGLGKTHLMQAIGHQMKTFGGHLNVLYVSSEAFMNAFIEAVASKRMQDFRNHFRSVDLLMVDDVQFFAGAEQTQKEFFHTFNVLYDAGKKIVLSSDHPPKDLQELEVRLRTRFEWGLMVDIQAPDLETRVAILRRKARQIGLDLPPEVTIFIAERIRSNLRKLEGALKSLAAAAEMTRQPITLETARTVLGPFLHGDEPRKITVEKVQLAVCSYFNLSMHELTGPNRSRKVSGPRQIAAYLTRELTDASFPEIGRKFGGRDHSSIIHAYNKVKEDMAVKLDMQNLVKYLTKLIKDELPQSGQ